MKGLLIKDIQMTLQNKRLLIVFFMLAVMMTLTKADAASFVIAFVTMFCGTLVLNTISLDEFDKSIVFLMTMPIDKTVYVLEKYAFAVGSGLIGNIVSSVFCIVFLKLPVSEILMQMIAIFVILSLFQMIILPIQLKFGSDIGRLVLIGIVIFFFVFGTFISEIGGEGIKIWAEGLLYQAELWIRHCSKWMIFIIGFVIWIGCVFGSFFISKNVMKKREF